MEVSMFTGDQYEGIGKSRAEVSITDAVLRIYDRDGNCAVVFMPFEARDAAVKMAALFNEAHAAIALDVASKQR